jgi:hypothetical protein
MTFTPEVQPGPPELSIAAPERLIDRSSVLEPPPPKLDAEALVPWAGYGQVAFLGLFMV